MKLYTMLLGNLHKTQNHLMTQVGLYSANQHAYSLTTGFHGEKNDDCREWLSKLFKDASIST